jgi:hypothetical protein
VMESGEHMENIGRCKRVLEGLGEQQLTGLWRGDSEG